MARAPTIAGRPAPQRKHRTSGDGVGTSSGAASSIAPRTLVSKAYKRAQKRAQLLAKTQGKDGNTDDEHAKARALLAGPTGTLSKSALRRRKRKAREELARNDAQGRKGGVGELKTAVQELEDDMEEEQDNGAYSSAATLHGHRNGEAQAGNVSAKERMRVLALEQSRQQAILNDPTFKASPFAALRQHARNTMDQQRFARGHGSKQTH